MLRFIFVLTSQGPEECT